MAQPQQRAPAPLEQLQGTMNLLLHRLGGAISDPNNRKDPSKRMTVQRLIPEANLRFHDALDKLEDDLLRAKAVMRRDLAVCRAAKAKLEAEAVAAQKPAVVDKSPERESTAAQENPDIAMSDNPPNNSTEKTTNESSKALPDNPTTAAPPNPTTSTTASLPEPIVTSTTAEDLTLNSPTTAGENKDFDIDSMFVDPLFDSPGNNNDRVNSIDMTDFQDTGADVSSLLPGLESYANIPDTSMPGEPDTSMVDTSMPETSGDTTANLDTGFDFSILGIPEDGQGEQKPQQQQQQQQDRQEEEQAAEDNGLGDMDAQDNSFNDLFDWEQEYGDLADQGTEGPDFSDWMNSMGEA